MQAAILPADEAQRLESLERMHLLSTPREAEFDRIVRIAQRCFGSDAALISLVDRNRQWFKARRGVEEAQTCRAVSFCGHAILQDAPFVVIDASEDPRFADNPLVCGARGMRFYAGQALHNRDGHRIGTLCVLSHAPHNPSPQDLEVLQDLARLAELALERREMNHAHRQMAQALRTAERERLLDPMTGLWNRRGLRQILQRELEAARRRGGPLALAMVDIDHFKAVNDTHGHAAGDDTIRRMAEILVAAVRAEDAVVRHGGDEFIVLLPHVGANALAAAGTRLLRAVREGGHVELAARNCRFTASIGLSLLRPNGSPENEATDLLQAADVALYRAKEGGRNRFEIVPADRAGPKPSVGTPDWLRMGRLGAS